MCLRDRIVQGVCVNLPEVMNPGRVSVFNEAVGHSADMHTNNLKTRLDIGADPSNMVQHAVHTNPILTQQLSGPMC